MADVKIKGLEEIIKNLQKLSNKEMKKIMRKATRAGAGEIRKTAKKNAKALDDPKTPENISKNIVTRARRTIDKSEIKMSVGILGGARQMGKYGELKGAGKGNAGGDTFYWRFLEFGTSKMPAKPLMRNAMMSSQQQAFDKTVEKAKEEFKKL